MTPPIQSHPISSRRIRDARLANGWTAVSIEPTTRGARALLTLPVAMLLAPYGCAVAAVAAIAHKPVYAIAALAAIGVLPLTAFHFHQRRARLGQHNAAALAACLILAMPVGLYVLLLPLL